MTPLHLHESLIKMNMKNKMNTMIKFNRRAMIKGEMRMMGTMEIQQHIQECVTMFKEITPSITYLAILRKG
jgi:hypothetical protein